MTNNNDWKETALELLKSGGAQLIEGYIETRFGNKHVCEEDIHPYFTDPIIKYISQNFIPLSSLKKFIEENEKNLAPYIRSTNGDGYKEAVAHNSALKLLKDKFIHNDN